MSENTNENKTGTGPETHAFDLNRMEKLDSEAVAAAQEKVDVSEIVAKYDKESSFRSFTGWRDLGIRAVCIAFSACAA